MRPAWNVTWTVISRESQTGHIYLFVSIPPACCSRGFQHSKKRLRGWHLWRPSCYVGTAGRVSAETIRRYIERSGHVTKRR